MTKCSTCARKERESPGCLEDCIRLHINVVKKINCPYIDWHFRGHQPKPAVEEERVCETCGGSDEVRVKSCGTCCICLDMPEPWPINSCSHSRLAAKPCPDCQPAQPKRKVVPCHWQHNVSDCRHELIITETDSRPAWVWLHNGRWYATISGGILTDNNNEKVWRNTEEEIKQVAEQALGVEEVEIEP